MSAQKSTSLIVVQVAYKVRVLFNIFITMFLFAIQEKLQIVLERRKSTFFYGLLSI